MTDNLKFIKDLEAKSIVLSRSRVARNLDSLDTLLMENSRLKRELAESKEENLRLRERLGKIQTPQVVPKIDVQITSEAAPKDAEIVDDTAVRFSLLELK